MTAFPWSDVVIILILILLNGVFAMSELAIVSSRAPRLQAAEKRGSRGAKIARQLASDPGRFLSTVQVGITLIGVLTGAYSGSSLGQPVAERLQALFGLDAETALSVAFAVVIALTTYASLIAGELVPKQFALRAPERIAIIVAPMMYWLSKIGAPLVWLLDASSALVFRILGLNRESEDRVTAEELHLIVAEASKSGVIEESERAIISGVVRLADRPVREVMTPRKDVDWIDVALDARGVRDKLVESPHSRLPVARGSVDDIVGVVQARDIASALFRGEPLDLEQLMRPTKVIHDQIDAMDALEALRAADVPMLLVHDEYGHFDGLVTPADLLSAIAGEFASDQDIGSEPFVVEREDGSLLIAGSMPADQMAERLGIELGDDRDYATAAGHALAILKHLPKEGERFTDKGWRFEIVDMDGRKIDKLLVTEISKPKGDEAE
ncbi:hemolysin family protein [Sphingopyxis sp. RIFCSPHIGHO2_12_FULL_65_19]|uniref:hemolysin family protein n=1 Tax=Sphingopyxis sp. RIFCSPHIGHO2_12_FULL_65_19 TaxID=1802172 RepID=UPI0008D65C1F|nr:hemolysin family protein [Sphingopyxis sp. RIFCSPHIGHO2_12_FULL_65_19]OHD08249.1 MAG: DNA-binding protein [Sphingopyxis sp. RIFCSPHIGHO2_12_FULL_65_19]